MACSDDTVGDDPALERSAVPALRSSARETAGVGTCSADARYLSAARVGFDYAVLDEPACVRRGFRRCRGFRTSAKSTCGPTSPTRASRACTSSAWTPVILSAVWGARIFYRLPYWHAAMKIEGTGLGENSLPKQAIARAQAGRVALVVWTRQALNFTPRPDRSSTSCASDTACMRPLASGCIEPTSTTCHGRCKRQSAEVGTQHDGANRRNRFAGGSRRDALLSNPESAGVGARAPHLKSVEPA